MTYFDRIKEACAKVCREHAEHIYDANQYTKGYEDGSSDCVDAILALREEDFSPWIPDDLSELIYEATLQLHKHRGQTEHQINLLFQKFYRMYVKYGVDRAHYSRSCQQLIAPPKEGR